MLKIQSAGGEEPLEYLWTRAGEEGGAAHGRQQAGLQRQSTVERAYNNRSRPVFWKNFLRHNLQPKITIKELSGCLLQKILNCKPNGTKIQFLIGSLSILP